jgi:hypothetical protein
MREWQGLREDLSVTAPDGLATATNLSLRVIGEARRRAGLAGRIDEAGVLVTEWTDPFGTGYLIFNNGSGTLKSVRISDGTETSLATLLNANLRGCYAKSNGRLYFVNDFNPMQRFERGDTTGGVAGITAPTGSIGTPLNTATGVVTPGTHGMRYRYFDSKSLYMSDPSGQTDITTVSGTSLTFEISASGGTGTVLRSTDPKVDQIIIELTDAGSSTFYRAATINQVLTGTSVNLADSELRVQVAAARDGDFGHQKPPLCSMLIEHRGRLFGWGTSVYVVTGVAVTTGDTSAARVTVTGQTFSTEWAGRLLKIGSDTKAYRIVSVTGVSGLVLSEAYTGTAATYTGAQIFSATPDMLYWTRAGFPESWNPTSFARRVLQNQSDTPAGFASYNETLYLMGQRTIRALDYTADPATGSLNQTASEMGLFNIRCLIEANGRLYGWGRSGAWSMNGLNPVHLSRPVDAAIDSTDSTLSHNYDPAKIEQFHGVYDPRERVLLWYYATSSETYPKHAICYDLDRKQWSIRTYKQSMRASCLTTGGTTNPTRALVADENGYSWYLTLNAFDGVPASMSGGVVTVVTGSTTVIQTVETLSVSPTLVGVVATTATGSVERLISANTATGFTVSVAYSSAPVSGTEIYLGQMNFTLKSKWITLDMLDAKKRPSGLAVRLVPGTSGGKLTLNVFLDYSGTAKTYTKGTGDIDPDGVTITNGSADVVLDNDGGSGDGVLYVPLPGEWHRAIAWEINSTRPKDLLKVLDVEFLYSDPRSIVRVTDE